VAQQGNTGLTRIFKAFFYSMNGIKAAFANEAAFRQEVFLTVVLLPVALWLGETGVEKALLVTTLLLVLIVELLNTGIEAVVDRVGTEHHQLSGMAKDIASASVFLSLLNVVVVWGLVLFL